MNYRSVILWHDASEELPEESCAVYIIRKKGGFFDIDIPYSAVHKKFNARDSESYADACTSEIKGVKYWCEAHAFLDAMPR